MSRYNNLKPTNRFGVEPKKQKVADIGGHIMSAKEEITRRDFVKAAAIAAGGTVLLNSPALQAQPKGQRPAQAPDVQVLNPQNRVPMSFIIDFLMWSAVIALLLSIPLIARAWRAEVLRQHDPQFHSTSWFGAVVRRVHRIAVRPRDDDAPEL